MILFEEDWDYYPSAVPDYNTTNETFIKYCDLLDEMGVSNNLWPLQLMQPQLSGIDLYKDGPDLDIETKAMVATECRYNLFYFLREVCRIAPVAGINPVQFRANRGNMSLMWSFCNHIEYMLIQIRQTGKSVSTDALSTWLQLFGMSNSRELLITKDDTLRRENVVRLRKMRGYLPKWLVVDDKTDAANQTMTTYNTRDNRLITAVGQNSEDQALNVGRGCTVPVLRNDEGPFTSFIDITLPAAKAAGNAARDEAAKNGLPYGTIYTTTAGKIDSRSGGYMYKFYVGGTRFHERFYDFEGVDAIYKVLRSNGKQSGEAKKVLFIGEWDHLQLGYTDEWLSKKLEETGASGEEADRDFFNCWTSGGLSSPLPVAIIEAIQKSEIRPVEMPISSQGYVTNWFLPQEEINKIMKTGAVCVGVDTSDAIGQDDIALVYTDIYNQRVIGTAFINETSIIKAAEHIAQQLVENEKMIVNIEKKSSAMTFIAAMTSACARAGICAFKKMFNRIVENKHSMVRVWEEIQNTPLSRRTPEWYHPYLKYFGFNTTGSSRDYLFSQILTEAAKRMSNEIRCSILSTQIRKLVVKNGRIDHSNGNHDDGVFAWLLSNWFYMAAKNLVDYGIDLSKIKSRMDVGGKIMDAETLRQVEEQRKIREEIDEITERLKATKNEHLMDRLIANLKNLETKLTDEEKEILSLDQLISTTKSSTSEKMIKRQERRTARLQRGGRRAFMF